MKKFTEWMEEQVHGNAKYEWSSGGMNFKDEYEKNVFWAVVHGYGYELNPMIKNMIEDFFNRNKEAKEEIGRLSPELARRAKATILVQLAKEYDQ